jgi:hypothetical protein
MSRDFPESEEAAYWRRVNTAVPLTFATLATIAYLLRVYATVVIARRVRIEDFFMGFAVILMIGDTASVVLSASCLVLYLYFGPAELTFGVEAFNGMGVPDKDLPEYRQVNFKLVRRPGRLPSSQQN